MKILICPISAWPDHASQGREMIKRWFHWKGPCWQREPSSFPVFPDLIKDPDGTFAKWLEMAQIEPLWARQWIYKPGWSLGPRVWNDSFWFWFEKGPGWLEIGPGNQRHKFQAGDMLLVPYGVPHTMGYDSPRQTEVITVHFQFNLYPAIPVLSLLGFPYVVRGSRDAPFRQASEELAREFVLESPGWKQAMRALIMEVLLYIVRQRGHSFRMAYGLSAGKCLPRLIPIFEWVENHLHEPAMNTGDLARRIGVSEVYLRHLFRQGLGFSPVIYVRRCRVERACSLLRSTDKSIKEIAIQAGFGDAAFFTRVFRALTKASPTQYRASITKSLKVSPPRRGVNP